MQMGAPWTVVWNDPQKVPYAYQGNQWVGYDNPLSVALKVNYAKEKRLGGVMIWSVETDDFRGICGARYPILATINANLQTLVDNQKLILSLMKMWHQLTALVLLTILAFASSATDKVVCYYGSWAAYRPGNGRFEVEDIDPTLCTHLIYAFVGLNPNGSIRIIDPNLDINKGGFKRFNALKSRNPKVKTLISIGGWNEKSEVFAEVASTSHLRTAFVNNALNFVKTHGFDGFDLDWEYPGERGGSSCDWSNFSLLVKEFKQVFKQHGLLITAAVGATASLIRSSYEVPILSANLDFINVMTYDLHGEWEKVTGHHSPLHAAPHETTPSQLELNIEACIDAWIKNGAAPEKLFLGVASFGHSFTLDNAANNRLGAPASQPGLPGPYTKQAGTLGYNEVCEMQMHEPWNVTWFDPQRVPYAYRANQWVGYDTKISIALKVYHAQSLRLGGMMVWSIDTDDFRGICGPKYPLITAINENL
ncbi:hypothetical protein ILUMI_10196 [Ignelater luminosus]|uniref:GH18 domain-containing protein n=1 Tax=Ignelater luminosus TaxID=2038154 RepID=A0A8K0GDU8_IGNLU|nr:hypothetical protein ILUMI_10196 [Ignelater luminosus]